MKEEKAGCSRLGLRYHFIIIFKVFRSNKKGKKPKPAIDPRRMLIIEGNF
jgi:hypothetical protein